MIEPKKLPYKTSSLEPHLSERSVELHYYKHHWGYANKLNQLTQKTKYANMGLDAIIQQTAWVHGPNSHRASKSQEEREQYVTDLKIYNNAAQVWNHDFLWRSMSGESVNPTGDLLKKIKKDFGSLGALNKAIKNIAVDHFGAGWLWMLLDEKLVIEAYPNAITPLSFQYPKKSNILFCMDLWEHQWLYDYENKKVDFVDVFVNELLDWDAAGERFKGAQK